jgi:hypothetical protein
MSYPKRPPVLEKETERATQLSHKRDQIKNLLVNKFRGKFNAMAQTDDFEAVIRYEVDKFVNSQQMSEQNLIALDKSLTQLAQQKGFALNKRNSTRALNHNVNSLTAGESQRQKGYRPTVNGLNGVN